MEFHRSQLRKLCRLCGASKGVIHTDRRPYCKLNFQKLIEQGLNIDVHQDDSNIHPPSICQTCRKKIDRWKKDRRNKKSLQLNVNVHNYGQHSETQCDICLHTDEDSEQSSVFKHLSHPTLTKQETEDSVQFVRLSTGEKITLRLTIHKSFTWSLSIHGKYIDRTVPELSCFPETLTVKDATKLLSKVGEMAICTGNTGFETLCLARSEGQPVTFKSTDGKSIVAFQERFIDYGLESVRHVNCSFFVTEAGSRCDICKHYRSTLATASRRLETKSNNTNKRNDYMTKEEITNKLKSTIKENRSMKRIIEKTSELLKCYIQDHGEDIDQDISSSFVEIMNSHERDVLNSVADGSNMKILWEQQKKALSAKTKSGMRWHPSMIKWCIALHSKSAAAYEMLQSSGALILPHRQTLRKYTQFADPTNRPQAAILKKIKTRIEFSKLPSFKKNVTLAFDEMKIKDGLVYNSSTGKLIGFIQHDNINEEIDTIVNECTQSPSKAPPLATHMLALMVRGIFLNLQEVFAFYPCDGFTSYQLYWTVWRNVGILEKSGFQVRAFSCDGASPNRKFYRLHQTNREQQFSAEPCHFTKNIYCPSRSIYFFSDPPHLMKTVRNNWENSNWNRKSRRLTVSDINDQIHK